MMTYKLHRKYNNYREFSTFSLRMAPVSVFSGSVKLFLHFQAAAN
jgi:hypothetical protein